MNQFSGRAHVSGRCLSCSNANTLGHYPVSHSVKVDPNGVPLEPLLSPGRETLFSQAYSPPGTRQQGRHPATRQEVLHK
ncbi:MAG: hypothetical protein H6707_01070 [Deltaproteobacteria bacterium]|nr:hypothetical protein [Deltaproteobacteria bacterium]